MIEYDQTVLWPQMTEDVSTLKTDRLTSLLKWAGGKEQELKYILPLIPSFTAYYETFEGSTHPQKHIRSLVASEGGYCAILPMVELGV